MWINTTIVFPNTTSIIQPHPDMPEEIRADFQEAARIAAQSPRGSAALARLCVQNLCIVLGESGKNLNADIGALVKRGLNPMVQKVLDSVRVIGNNTVHPGEIDIRDNIDIAVSILRSINLLIDRMIREEKEAKLLYNSLPKSSKDQIARRDKE